MRQEFEQVKKYIELRQKEMLEFLKEMVERPSCGREPEDVKAFVPWLKEQFEKEGFTCHLEDPGHGNGPTLVGELGAERPGKPILFTGHYDTALYKELAKQNPFRIEEGKIYGSGVLDMKGGIVIALYVIKALNSIGYEKHPIKVIWSGDEEINHVGSRGAEIIIEEAKGGLCAFNMETGLVSNQLCIGRKGGARARVTVTGVEAHAGNDFTKGRSSIVEMAHKIIEIHNLTDLNTGTTMNIGTIQGGTIFNAVPAKCEIVVDMRFESNIELEKAREKFRQVCEKTHIEGTSTQVEDIDMMRVFETTKGGMQFYSLVEQTAKEEDLPQVGSISLGGSSDAACTTIAGVPTICSFGTMGEWNHTIREYALVESLYQRPVLIAAVILKIGERNCLDGCLNEKQN